MWDHTAIISPLFPQVQLYKGKIPSQFCKNEVWGALRPLWFEAVDRLLWQTSPHLQWQRSSSEGQHSSGDSCRQQDRAAGSQWHREEGARGSWRLKDTKGCIVGLRESEKVAEVLLCLWLITCDRYNSVIEVHALSCKTRSFCSVLGFINLTDFHRTVTKLSWETASV